MKAVNSNIIFSLLVCAMALYSSVSNAQTSWDFSTLSDDDKALCAADANWILGTDRYCYTQALTEAALTANGTELAYTKGLKFTATAATEATEGKAKLRCNYGSSRFELNGANIVLIIPNLTAGQKVTVSCKTGKTDVARGFNVENITPVSGFFNSTSADAQTNVGTVAADGDVKLTTTAGMYVYSIKVEDVSGTDPVTPTDDNSVSMNVNKNQIRLHLDNDIKYYNTEDVSLSIDKAAGTVTVTPVGGTWNDVYTKAVSTIDFSKAEATGSEGNINNPAGAIEITEAKGWQECAYIKWKLYDGASSYNVYVKGGQYSDYTMIDYQLVRNYGTYGRADVVGLKKDETYSIKIVAVDADQAELDGSASEATDIMVKGYDRSGFAFMNGNVPGAYNADGTLKTNARVIYVSASSAKTVSLPVLNGKSETTLTGLQTIINGYQKGLETRPLCVRLIGKITDSDMDELGSSAEGLQVKGKDNSIEMNITIEGVGEDATIYGFGLLLRNAVNVELRNFGIMLCMDDCVSLDTDNKYCWIHNLDLFYGNTGGDSDQAKGDGTLDVKDDSQYMTFAYNHLFDSGKASLCGMTSESGPNYIDYHHNWFDHSDSRHPRVRTMSVHVWNNYYDGVAKYGIGATTGSSVFVENNYFRHSHNPMLSSKQGRDALGGGTFSGDNGGMIKSFGNVYAETNNSEYYLPITQNDNATSFDCYEASSRDEQIPSSYVTLAGGTSYDNFDTNGSLMYAYTPDATADVPYKVTGYYGAGRMNHGDFQWTFDNSTEDTNYAVISALKSALQSYTSNLVGIFDGENMSSGGETGGDTGGNEGGSTGGETIEDTVLCSFDANGSPSASQVTANATALKSGASVTVDGVTYSNCLKLNSSCTITVTVDKAVKMTIYFGNTSATTVKVDGTAYSVTNQQTEEISLTTGTHTITKGSGEGAVALIKLVPAE